MTEVAAGPPDDLFGVSSSAGRCRPARWRRRCCRRRSRCRSSRPTRSRPSRTRRSRLSSCSSPRRRRRASRLPDLDRDRRPARDRRPLVPADRPRVRDERRRVRRRAGEPRHAAEPRRRRGAPHRLRPDRRRLDLGGDLRDHVVRAVALQAQGRALARLPAPDRARQPARRARVGPAVRAPDLRVRAGRRSARGRRARRARDRECAPRGGASRPSGGDRRDHPVRPAAGVLVRLDRADRRRGDRERRQRVPAPAGQERREDARRARRDRDHALPRRLVPRGPRARASERHRLRRLADRTRGLPERIVRRLHVLRRAGSDAARPDPRGEHVVPGLPAPLRAARPRPLRAAAVHEPRRPARLLERRRRACRRRGASAVDLRREHEQPDPPLRDRRLHRVHALAGRDGALLAAHAGRLGWQGKALSTRSARRRRAS